MKKILIPVLILCATAILRFHFSGTDSPWSVFLIDKGAGDALPTNSFPSTFHYYEPSTAQPLNTLEECREAGLKEARAANQRETDPGSKTRIHRFYCALHCKLSDEGLAAVESAGFGPGHAYTLEQNICEKVVLFPVSPEGP